MLIFDGDYPMAYGALDLNRDLTLPIGEARAQPDKNPATLSPNVGIMATLPEMQRGRVAAALVKVAARIKRPGSPLWGYASAHSAYAAAQGGLAYYRILERQGQARILCAREDVEGHVELWRAAEASGADGAPADIDTVADYQKLEALLARRGYSPADIEGICHRNWARFYARWLPARR